MLLDGSLGLELALLLQEHEDHDIEIVRCPDGEMDIDCQTCGQTILCGSPHEDPAVSEGEEKIAALGEVVTELGLEEDALDDAVHDAKGGEAADINNGGFIRQLAYLYEGTSFEDAKKELQALA